MFAIYRSLSMRTATLVLLIKGSQPFPYPLIVRYGVPRWKNESGIP